MIVNVDKFKNFMHYKSLDKNRIIKKLFILMIIYNLLDSILTYVGLKYFEANESNPIVGQIVGMFGLELTIIIKIVFFTGLFWYLRKAPKFNKKLERTKTISIFVWGIISGIYFFAVINNFLFIITS